MDIYLIIQIVIGIAAFYGLVVSSYNLSMNIRKSRYRVKVTLKKGFVAIQSPTKDALDSENTFLLKAQNIGYRMVTLNSMGYKIPKIKKDLAILNPESNVRFPYELKEGKDCIVWSNESYIKEKLRKMGLSGNVKLIGIYVDGIGKEYRSKPLKYNIDNKS